MPTLSALLWADTATNKRPNYRQTAIDCHADNNKVSALNDMSHQAGALHLPDPNTHVLAGRTDQLELGAVLQETKRTSEDQCEKKWKMKLTPYLEQV